MTSTILNFIVDRYLANFIEINTSQTKASIWSGIVEMQNLKIKNEIFQTMNLPYLELVNGYVGKLRLELSMPRFYSHPIKVYVDKIFFHARQKNIDKLNKDEEIKNLEIYKQSKLLNQEQLTDQVNQLKNEGAGMVQQIMNNLQIEIGDIVFRFDDEMSNPKVPYSLGIILGKVIIHTTRSDYKLPKDLNENIPYEEINYKLIKVDNFSIYMDTYFNKNDINYEKLIDPKIKDSISSEIRNFLGQLLNFYAYCQSEVYTHSQNQKSHQFLLYYLDMDVKIAINDNLKNGKPQYDASLIFEEIYFNLSLKQMATLFKVLAYINLNSYYQLGIAKDFYKKKITEEEQKNYIEGYIDYYKEKYIKKNANFAFPQNLSKIEDGLTYEKIQTMRAASIAKMDYIAKIVDLENKIKTEEGRWFGTDKELIKKYKEDLEKLKKLEEQENLKVIDKLDDNFNTLEIDVNADLPDEFVLYHALFEIKKTKMLIYEDYKKVDDEKDITNNWESYGQLIEFLSDEFIINGDIRKKGYLFVVSLKNTCLSQFKVKNRNYYKIMFGENDNTEDKVLYCEYESNPKFEKSDNRFLMNTERRLILIGNIYALQYINSKVMTAMSNSISFREITSYAQDSVSKYIQSGYVTSYNRGNFQHYNLYMDIKIKSPIIIIPQNIMDLHNNNCFYMHSGELNIRTELPPRQKLEIDYKIEDNPDLLYDEYIVDIKNIHFSTMENCTENTNFFGKESLIVKDFDLYISTKLLFEPKNQKFDDMIIFMEIPGIDFNMSEFQILFCIDYLQSMTEEGIILQLEIEEENKRLGRDLNYNENEEINNFLEKQNAKEIKEKAKPEEEEKQEIKPVVKKEEFKSYFSFVYKIRDVTKKQKKKPPTLETIKKKKKSLNFKFNIFKVKWTLSKNYPDLTVCDYIVFQQNLMSIVFDMTSEGDMIFNMNISNIGLYDKDLTIKKAKLVNKHFECLVESFPNKNKNKNDNNNNNNALKHQSFINILFYYINEISLSETVIVMNNLNIVISLDSILRLYQFGMYYYEKYNDMISLANRNNNEKIKLQRERMLLEEEENEDDDNNTKRRNTHRGNKNDLD